MNEARARDIRIELLPTSITADKYPIHKWFNFIAGYSPEYVELVINEYSNKHGKRPMSILDPFSGCATTSVVSNELGIKSMGIERNPFFFKIGFTKAHASLTIPYLKQIAIDFRYACLKNVSSSLNELSVDAQKYLLKLYSDENLKRLLDLRKVVESYEGYKYFMGYTFLSKILEFVTTAKTDGIYKAPTSTKKGIAIGEAITKAEKIFLDGKNEIQEIGCLAEYIYDSCVDFDIPEDKFDLVIFSPPYLNNFDFAEMTRMQLYFWNEADSWRDISDKHRNHMLVNTTTALKLVREQSVQDIYKNSLPPDLREKIMPIVSELERLYRVEKKSKDYFRIIYPYLGQMKKVLAKCYLGLKKGGEIHIVVSDAAFYGIHIDTQEYLGAILKDLGAHRIVINRMRDRGDRWVLDKRAKSIKQLGEYEVIAFKE